MQALEHIDDPRSPSNGTRHDFRELLVVAICAMLSDNDTFEEMVAWARYKQDWLRGFLKLANGIPSEDTFIRVFRMLDPKQFEQAFRDWTGNILPALSHETLAIDGKTSCRIPSDHIPIRSWPLFLARELMRDLIETLKAEQST